MACGSYSVRTGRLTFRPEECGTADLHWIPEETHSREPVTGEGLNFDQIGPRSVAGVSRRSISEAPFEADTRTAGAARTSRRDPTGSASFDRDPLLARRARPEAPRSRRSLGDL